MSSMFRLFVKKKMFLMIYFERIFYFSYLGLLSILELRKKL